MIEGITYFDIGVLVIVLIFIISGIRKGFINGIIGLVGLIVSLVVAIHFAGAFAEVLEKPIGEPINNWISTTLTNTLNPTGEPNVFTQDLTQEDDVALIVAQTLEALKIPKLLSDSIAPRVAVAISASIEESGPNSIVAMFTLILGRITLLLISGIILFIGAKIILAIIESIFNSLLKTSKTLRNIDRLLGAFVGVAKAAVVLVVVFTVIMFSLSGVAPDADSPDLKVKVRTNIENSSVAKFIYDNNPLPTLISEKINFQELLSGILPVGDNAE